MDASPFARLPAELREEIWLLSVLQPDSNVDIPGTGACVNEPSLLAICRQIRAEALFLYYGENVFHIGCRLSRWKFDYFLTGHEWLSAIGSDRARMIRYLSICLDDHGWTGPFRHLQLEWIMDEWQRFPGPVKALPGIVMSMLDSLSLFGIRKEAVEVEEVGMRVGLPAAMGANWARVKAALDFELGLVTIDDLWPPYADALIRYREKSESQRLCYHRLVLESATGAFFRFRICVQPYPAHSVLHHNHYEPYTMDASPFNDLHGEMRNRIWRFAVLEPAGVEITLEGGMREPAILATCRQIREEAIDTFHAENVFRLTPMRFRALRSHPRWPVSVMRATKMSTLAICPRNTTAGRCPSDFESVLSTERKTFQRYLGDYGDKIVARLCEGGFHLSAIKVLGPYRRATVVDIEWIVGQEMVEATLAKAKW